jgi:ribosomal protein S8
MNQAKFYRNASQVRKHFIMKKIDRIDIKIEKFLKANNFIKAEEAEKELYKLECELLKNYNMNELNELFMESFPA